MEKIAPASQCLVLAGDAGGTHTRFATVDLSDPAQPRILDALAFASAEHESFEAALGAYLERTKPSPHPATAVIAVAGPVMDGAADLTNLSWHVSEAALKSLGFAHAMLVNDFQALAAAAGALGDNDLACIGPALPRDPAGTVAIMGAGTGFGVSALVRSGGESIAAPSEGGHIGFSPEDETEIEILRVLARRFGRVSIERIVSGPGLVNLYTALCEIGGEQPHFDGPPQILEAAGCGDVTAREAAHRLAAIFGAAAGDLALAYAARGGVLLAGGLTRALLPYLEQGAFRRRFEGKGRLAPFARRIPTHLIVREDAALLGCARLAHDLLNHAR